LQKVFDKPGVEGTYCAHSTGFRGVAVDKAFLTEMSNLSPPIIYPPPSAL